MLLQLLDLLFPPGSLDDPGALRVLRYVSVRCSLALTVAFLLSVFAGGPFIRMLRRYKAGQYIREDKGKDAIDLSAMHGGKAGTPTMGGILILFGLLVPCVLFCDWRQPVVGLALAMGLGFGTIGFIDDFRKLTKKNSKGLTAMEKIVGQVALGVFFGALFGLGDYGIRYTASASFSSTDVALPFFKNGILSFGMFYILYAAFVLTASSNSVNLTDGLDGLAIGVTISVALCLGAVAYLVGRPDLSAYLIVPHVPGGGELAVIMSALVGAGLGFLWFNSHPAALFMGDTGSMLLGGLLGATALILKQEGLLIIVGGIFVAEAVSVILQVISFKFFKRRIFRMSPLHHHFEKLGWAEPQIIARFYIVSLILALAGLSSLKIR